ncbi:Cys/Met metabolism, pyridoxal phosphate-dependent enzyme [Cordyceps fumosorosea ARSEF 2679]|uniref:Cys/Met metabolism, pyridoxal phosphate-dependent enzyme n=1 Tax=Cordyceps fumosorosea (strain ARSEF 2679) TaxID=1081104 RepID=A0A167R238_CORFA|nr:Cys/Met metabolism, pyridoxal phosphate-dependent enzyme [Cordyceps fumosorosea ARSEF 2679]OAA58198.1 Cys/Met metabolism, pyridoxal phosphate-dependent enzyme [Cordyceps fumosorosea ARSEF 2679]
MPAYSTVPKPPSLGHRVPDRPHAVSVHLPRWRDVVDFSAGDSRVRSVQKGGYPRSFLHEAIVTAHRVLAEKFGSDGQSCLLFPTRAYALACERYLCAPPDGSAGVAAQEVSVRPFSFAVEQHADRMTLHAAFFPKDKAKNAMIFWRLTGCGISSRLAQDMLPGLESVSVADSAADTRLPRDEASEKTIRERLAGLLDRAPVDGPREQLVRPEDVFLYPTGMSAIYNCTLALGGGLPGAQMVVFGFPYELTLKVQEDFAKACTFYGFGTDEELDQFEHLLASKAAAAPPGEPPIQAVWCECASNPLLRTVDLDRVRRLADRYGFVVVVDDTIGSAANVDVLGVADIVATSLTKTFSGYADVMGGSLVVNPCSAHHSRLRALLLDGTSHGTLYRTDAAQLERNSRDYLSRTAILNQNASYLVSLLSPLTASHHPRSPLSHVYHPSTCWSAANYAARMRAPTADFAPGFGYLLTLEFCSVEAAGAFFDALRVCKGPSIGAQVTLALPYVQVVFAQEKAWAARYGLSEAIVRISVGLEDKTALAMACLEAMRAADATVNGEDGGEERDAADAAGVEIGREAVISGLDSASLPPLVPQI